jgi:hypothetical protein
MEPTIEQKEPTSKCACDVCGAIRPKELNCGAEYARNAKSGAKKIIARAWCGTCENPCNSPPMCELCTKEPTVSVAISTLRDDRKSDAARGSSREYWVCQSCAAACADPNQSGFTIKQGRMYAFGTYFRAGQDDTSMTDPPRKIPVLPHIPD